MSGVRVPHCPPIPSASRQKIAHSIASSSILLLNGTPFHVIQPLYFLIFTVGQRAMEQQKPHAICILGIWCGAFAVAPCYAWKYLRRAAPANPRMPVLSNAKLAGSG